MRGRQVRRDGGFVHSIEDRDVARLLDETQLRAEGARVLGHERVQDFDFVRTFLRMLFERAKFHQLVALEALRLRVLGFAVNQFLLELVQFARERQSILLHFLARRRQIAERLLQIVRDAGRNGFQVLRVQAHAQRQRERK